MQKKKSQKEDIKNSLPIILTTSTITELLNISRETLSNWSQYPSWPKDAKTAYGKYDLKKVLDWRDLYIIGDPDTAKQMAQEKLKYQIARSERERLETAKLQGLLVEREKYNQRLVEVAVATKDSLLLWVKRLPPILELQPEEHKRDALTLKKEIYYILNTMAKGLDAVKKYIKEA